MRNNQPKRLESIKCRNPARLRGFVTSESSAKYPWNKEKPRWWGIWQPFRSAIRFLHNPTLWKWNATALPVRNRVTLQGAGSSSLSCITRTESANRVRQSNKYFWSPHYPSSNLEKHHCMYRSSHHFLTASDCPRLKIIN
jgi:hypothetical protein